MEQSEELLSGIQLLMKGLGVEKAIMGIENNKPDAIAKDEGDHRRNGHKGSGTESEISPGR